jgi:hypothetical protein
MEGEILKNKITQDIHMVKRIEGKRMILESRNGSVWISLRKGDLEFYYERVEGGDA